MLKLKLQHFGHLIWRADSLEKTLMLGKIEGRRKRGWQRMRWLDSITDSWTWVWVNSGSWRWTGRPGVLQPMGLQRVRHDWASELDWTGSVQISIKKKSVQWETKCTLKWDMLFWFIFSLPNSQKFVSTFVLEAYVGLGWKKKLSSRGKPFPGFCFLKPKMLRVSA